MGAALLPRGYHDRRGSFSQQSRHTLEQQQQLTWKTDKKRLNSNSYLCTLLRLRVYRVGGLTTMRISNSSICSVKGKKERESKGDSVSTCIHREENMLLAFMFNGAPPTTTTTPCKLQQVAGRSSLPTCKIATTLEKPIVLWNPLGM